MDRQRLVFRPLKSLLPVGVGLIIIGVVLASPEITRPNQVEAEAAVTDLPQVAEALGKSPSQIQILDQVPLELAFVEGKYVHYMVRDLTTGKTLNITLDLDTSQIVALTDLKKRDRDLASSISGKLSPDFLDLLLAHPRLPGLQTLLVFNLESVQNPGETPPMDWLEPELRKRFQSALDDELARLNIRTKLTVRNDWPTLGATLSAQEVIRLAQSNLIETIKLMADPDILDD